MLLEFRGCNGHMLNMRSRKQSRGESVPPVLSAAAAWSRGTATKDRKDRHRKHSSLFGRSHSLLGLQYGERGGLGFLPVLWVKAAEAATGSRATDGKRAHGRSESSPVSRSD